MSLFLSLTMSLLGTNIERKHTKQAAHCRLRELCASSTSLNNMQTPIGHGGESHEKELITPHPGRFLIVDSAVGPCVNSFPRIHRRTLHFQTLL